MGVKNFRTEHDAYAKPARLCSVFAIYFTSLPRCHRLRACGKIVCFYRAALFPRLRHDNLFLPRCHHLARHDIYVFTMMPFFCCATIFMISPRYPSFVASRYFHICTNFCLQMLTPASAARPYPARSLKFMPRWSRPLDAVLAHFISFWHHHCEN